MGIYKRKDSPYWWVALERRGQKPIYESTRVRHDAPSPHLRRENEKMAEFEYHTRMLQLATAAAGLEEKPAIGFRAYATWYTETIVPNHGAAARERSVIEHLKAHYGHTPLSKIERASEIERRAARMKLVSPSTVDRETDVLKSMLREAVPKYLNASPLVGLKRHRETVQSKKRRPRILSLEEERRLIAAAEDAETRALILVALDTLMRLTDVRTLRRDQVHDTFIHVEAPKVEPYDAELSTRAKQALAQLPGNGPFYFPSRHGSKPKPISVNTVWRIFKEACERANIPVGRKRRGVTFHGLRHTGTTRMLATPGVSPVDVMEQGGWSNMRQLSRYGHASREGKRRAVERG